MSQHEDELSAAAPTEIDPAFVTELERDAEAPASAEASAAPQARVVLPEVGHPGLVGRAFGEVVCALFPSVKADAIGAALDMQLEKGGRIGELLVQMGVLKHAQVVEALATQLEVPFLLEINEEAIPDDLVREIPIGFARQHDLVPLGRTDDGVVLVACTDPLNTAAFDDIRVLLQCELEVCLAPTEVVRQAINHAYDRATARAESALDALEDEEGSVIDGGLDDEIVDILETMHGDDEAPIIRLVNSLMSQAVKDRASDIHVEPFEREMLVRFRVDGVLTEIIRPPRRFKDAITTRVKIMAGLNIAEKRLPQDGRIRLKVAGKDIDIRVSTVPTTYGERIVMRLLDRSNVMKELSSLGLDTRTLTGMLSLINQPHGIMLVTGPTGSGKTTTLYGCLAQINKPGLNILTIEDPVEYQLRGVGQVQVNTKIDLTFASGLRSFLRQDPDVIMVGEIRDRETAEIAIQASMTGHLVLSTVHTNDSVGAVTRLVDMGVEPFKVASTLSGSLAQRLVRVICENCKESYQPSDEELALVGLTREQAPLVYRGTGCTACQQTGYAGRLGIYELLIIDDELQRLILKNVDAGSLKAAAREKGLVTLRENGASKVLEGVTTIAEVTRVTADEGIAVEEVI